MPSRTLYVSRPLLNAAALRSWAMANGFRSALPADDMHVTIAFSREALDWNDVPPDAAPLRVEVRPGTAEIKKLGEATVLRFSSADLTKRWQRFRRAGASWDHPSYQPHVTISYQGPAGATDLAPYTGPLLFGPERYKEVKTDWAAGVKETALKKALLLYLVRRAA